MTATLLSSRKVDSGQFTCQRTGESAVATGADGADGVCVLIMYCSGAAYLKDSSTALN